jgi:hypothetical protein
MPGRRVKAFILATFAFALVPLRALAFDPFTVLAAGNAAIGLADYASHGAAAVAETGAVFSALGELNDEILPGQDGNDPHRLARRIAEIEQAAREAGYTQEEIDSILQDARDSNQNLARSIRLLSRSIRLGKRVVVMTGLGNTLSPRDKAAQAASVATMQGQAEERKILSDIYGELVSRGLSDKKAEVETAKAHQEAYRRFRKFVLSLAPAGNLALFPIDSSVIQKAIDVYKSYAWILLILVGALFMSRVVYYQMSFAPAEQYAVLLRETFACFCLMLAFPYVYTYMLDCSEALALHLGQTLHVTGAPPPERISFGLAAIKSALPWWARPEVIQLVLYAVVHVVFNLVVAIMVALGPVIVLMGTMMNITFSLTAYFALLLFVLLWPTFWNVLGYFKGVLWANKGFSMDGIGSLIASGVLFLFQLFSPLAIYSMLKRTHGGQVAHQVSGGAWNRAKEFMGSKSKGSKGKGAAKGVAEASAAGAGPAGVAAAGAASAAAGAAEAIAKAPIITPVANGKLVSSRSEPDRSGILTGKERFDL